MSDFLNVFVDLISFRSGGKIFQKYDPEKDKLDLKRSIRGSGNIRFFELYRSGGFLVKVFR